MPDNLPELRDIHLPSEGVSAFPPAYGWYVIILALVGLWLLWRGFLVLRRKSKKRYAFRLLSAYPQNNIDSAVQMSNLLRRICVLKFPQATALFGQEWIDFLNQHGKKKILGQPAKLLINAPYIKPTSLEYSAEDVAQLRDFCREWIGENL